MKDEVIKKLADDAWLEGANGGSQEAVEKLIRTALNPPPVNGMARAHVSRRIGGSEEMFTIEACIPATAEDVDDFAHMCELAIRQLRRQVPKQAQ